MEALNKSQPSQSRTGKPCSQSNNNIIKEALTVNISLVVYEYNLTLNRKALPKAKIST
jgi:hypothetical protein